MEAHFLLRGGSPRHSIRLKCSNPLQHGAHRPSSPLLQMDGVTCVRPGSCRVHSWCRRPPTWGLAAVVLCACLITFGGGHRPRRPDLSAPPDRDPVLTWCSTLSSPRHGHAPLASNPRLKPLLAPPPPARLRSGSSLQLVPDSESRSLFALYYSATGMIVREGS